MRVFSFKILKRVFSFKVLKTDFTWFPVNIEAPNPEAVDGPLKAELQGIEGIETVVFTGEIKPAEDQAPVVELPPSFAFGNILVDAPAAAIEATAALPAEQSHPVIKKPAPVN